MVAISSEEKAIKCIADIASEGDLKINGVHITSNVSLDKIIKFDTETLIGKECELILGDVGRFILYDIKTKKAKKKKPLTAISD